MSLLLNGAKTMTFAGTEMQCLEIYTGESYTIGLSFTDAGGTPIDTSTWGINVAAKWYTVDNIDYPVNTPDEVVLGNITLDVQPTPADYTIEAAWSNAVGGQGYLYIGSDITGNGTTPTVALANSAANSTLVITTVSIDRASSGNASLQDVNREPIGFIVRYQ
jgi:hypothetical protein